MQLSEELELSYYRPVAEMQGGHGVCLVQHTESGKFFVRKTLSVYNEGIYRWLQNHPVPGTPHIYCVAEEEGILTVIEEYLSGDTFQELLDAGESFPEEEILSCGLQLANILRDLHHADPPIVHRDIKPSNLLRTPDGRLILLDFNAAKFVSEEETRDTILLGTQGFAAPEQYGFAASGVQTDIYAVGVLLNVLAAGELPTTKMAEGRLAPIIKKCTQLDPENRFPDTDALIEALEGAEGAESSSQTDNKKRKGWRRFLPPGFRDGSPVHAAAAVLGYVLIFVVAVGVAPDDVVSAADLLLNRLFVLLIMLLVLFFSADYLEIQEHVPFPPGNNRWIHRAAVILYDAAIVFGMVLLLVLLEDILF